MGGLSPWHLESAQIESEPTAGQVQKLCLNPKS
jgi:hypothetical protein